jgi:HK97 family phage prohead protease
MPIKKNREYRNLGEFGTSDDYMVEGYASTFDKYKMMTIDGKDYYEQIDRHAFDEADMTDVVFLRDHAGRVLARTKNGAVELSIDDNGLHQRTNLGLTGASREMYEDIATGNYQQMSFSFVVAEDRYDKDTRTRVIEKVSKVFDISAVAYPANPFTEIGVSARDYFNGVIEVEKAERLERAKAKLKLKTKLARSKK